MTLPDLPEPFGPLLDRPDAAAVLTDFDGTLAPIVDDPAAARPLDGAVEALRDCDGRYALVGVISGRPVAFLSDVLGPWLFLSGLYGLEVMADGAVLEHPEAARWRPVVEESADRAEAHGPAGLVVERKGLSLTLHFRTRPDLEEAARAWAVVEAVATGLEVRSARASVELHPPVPADKGTALLAATQGLGAVCFLGDDRGDLAAFDALDRLGRDGVHTVRVGVRSEEAPAEILERADVVVDGPAGAVGLLRSLVP